MSTTTQRLLSDIQGLAPEIISRIPEMEAEARIPVDLVEALKSIGVFRLLVPRSHDGFELELPEALKIITALSRIDGSVGWTVGIANGSSLFATLLPPEIYRQVYGNGPDAIMAGSSQPTGTAEATAGGWRVSGRWSFASGCQHADWIACFAILTQDGKPLPGPAGEGGPPLVRNFALPASEWQIEDTWHVAGLKGSGSHHVSLRDKLVPAANSYDVLTAVSHFPGPLYQAVIQFLPMLNSAITTGIAEAALHDLIEVANTGRRQLRAAAPLRDSEFFQGELGRISADLRAAQAFFDAQVASHWRHALAGTLKDEALFTEGLQAAIWIAAACIRVADACFTLAGSVSLYETSPLQRRMRDLHVAAQHFVAQPRNYVNAGKLLLNPPGPSAQNGHKKKETPLAEPVVARTA
jgi:alkylation response protein AidB-like acyl-CoA dehydrogenase